MHKDLLDFRQYSTLSLNYRYASDSLHGIIVDVLLCVSARRLEVYESENTETAVCSVTLKSGCSGKSLSCRSLSCNRSSVSLHTLTAEPMEEDQLSGHVQPRTGAFCSRMVRFSHTSDV